jgi:enoyl-CoA hydratase
MPDILFEKRGSVAWVTINRPEAKNTLSPAAFVGLAEAWKEVRDDRDIRCAVLTAVGDTDFCCGGDLGGVIPLWTGQKQPENEIEKKLLADPTIPDQVLLKNVGLYKPVISAINGRALGGGCEIIQATDIRIAADHAQFGLPECKVGIVPGGGSMVRLPRQIPYTQAMKIMLTGEPIDAQTALAIGLISDVVVAGKLLETTEEMAAKVVKNAPLSLQAIKKTALETHTKAWADAFQFEANESAVVVMSKDAREGPRAFKEKREPNFIGE